MARSNTLPPSRSSSNNHKSRRLERNSSQRYIPDSPPSHQQSHHSKLPHNPFHRSHHSDHVSSHPPPPTPPSHTTFPSRPSTIHNHNPNRNRNHTHNPQRPSFSAPNRQNSVQTRYMTMLLAQDTIPRIHTILASFSTWILLAGFVIFPGTFTSLSTLSKTSSSVTDSDIASSILKTVKHIQLLVIAGICSGIGALGMIILWYRWRKNYVWLLNKIFLPGCLNSFAGLISTLVSVYSQQGGAWSVTAWITAAVTGGCMVVTGVLFGLYNFWILKRVKRSHGVEMEGWREEGRGGEGLVEKLERKAHEPALEPGSVV